MRLVCMCLAVVLLAGGCLCPTDVTLHSGEKVGSLYYHERRAPDGMMIEMWIDFATRRLRFKSGPHDALGWNSRRFESQRLDIVMDGRELRRIADSIRKAKIESWENADGKDVALALDGTTYYVRMNTENGAIERLVAGHAPEGFSHFAEVIRFAALHKECRYQTGKTTARDCGRVEDFD